MSKKYTKFRDIPHFTRIPTYQADAGGTPHTAEELDRVRGMLEDAS